MGTYCHHLCENGWTDRFAIWVVISGGPKEAQVQSYLSGGANVPHGRTRRHQATMIEPSVCGGDATLCQIIMTTCSPRFREVTWPPSSCNITVLWQAENCPSLTYVKCDPNASINAETASPSSSRHRPRGYDLWRDMTMTRSRDMFSPVTEFYDWTPMLHTTVFCGKNISCLVSYPKYNYHFCSVCDCKPWEILQFWYDI